MFPYGSIWLRFSQPERFQTQVHQVEVGSTNGEVSYAAQPQYEAYFELVAQAYGKLLGLLLAELVGDFKKTFKFGSSVLWPLFVK